MTAKTLVRERRRSGSSRTENEEGGGDGGEREREREGDKGGVRDITARNVQKVTRFRKNGLWDLEREVRRLESLEKGQG